MAANKYSSSPVSSTKPNPSSRNSEIKDPMRRSFTGNPFHKPSTITANSRGGFNPNTPANSPAADFPPRSSFGRESFSSLRDLEDKENNKDSNLKPGRIRSPVAATKGTKNFMSPTISAASKFTPSPRKKILVDKNEPVRSSVSGSGVEKNEPFRNSVLDSDVKGQEKEEKGSKTDVTLSQKKTVSFSDAITFLLEDEDSSKSEMGFDPKVEASQTSTITDPVIDSVADPVASSDPDLDIHLSSSESVTEDKDCVNLDPTFKISPRTSYSNTTSSSTVAPLDADPLMPPYDPKTNFLSPRPQFLHYRPNPRIERIRSKDRGDGKRLEESFASENSSDSEVSEILSEESQVEESEESSSSETVKMEDEEEDELEEEEVVEAKGWLAKTRFFTRSKFIGLLFILIFTCSAISFSNSPAMLNDLSSNLYIPPEFTEFARMNVEGMAERIKIWSDNAFSYICKLAFDLSGGGTKPGPLQYTNLTALLDEDHLIDGQFLFGQSNESKDLKFEECVLEKTDASEEEYEEIEDDVEEDIAVCNEVLEEDDTTPEYEETSLTSLAEVIQQADEMVESDTSSDNEPQSGNMEVVDQPAGITEDTEEMVESDVVAIQPEITKTEPEVPAEAEEPHLESDMNSFAEIESTKVENVPQTSEMDASLDNQHHSYTEEALRSGLENETKDVTGISSLVLLMSLVAAVILPALFLYAKRGKPSTPIATPTTTPLEKQHPEVTKKLNYSPISVTAELSAFQERLYSRNWETDVDTYAESCPSEMSSFNKSSSTSKKNRPNPSSEAQSQEKGRRPRKDQRRESLASSEFSMGGGSPSFGSFTTYEKVHSKQGNGVEEVVTPVRRSSRIRKQVVTSP